MNNFFNRIDELLTECDEELSRQFPFWAAAPDWLKYTIALIAPFVILLLGMMALEMMVILYDASFYILQNPQLFQALTIAFLAFGIMLGEIRRHGVVVTAILTVALLLLMKYVAEQVRFDTVYIDTVLKTIVDVPRIVIEDVIPFVKEGVSVLFG